MSTSAGIDFTTSNYKVVRKMRKHLDELDEITNNGGLGVACTPHLNYWREDGTYYLSAQTHWSYDGENGREFVKELHKWLERIGVKDMIEIVETSYA